MSWTLRKHRLLMGPHLQLIFCHFNGRFPSSSSIAGLSVIDSLLFSYSWEQRPFHPALRMDHYLTHSRYHANGFFKRIWKQHRWHHYKNESTGTALPFPILTDGWVPVHK